MVLNIWLNSDNDAYRLRAIDKHQIIEVEDKLNVTLPEVYKQLCTIQNGGYIKFDAFPASFETNDGNDYIFVDFLFGIGEKIGILDSLYLVTEWDLPNRLVLLSGDGHSWIALDYRHSKIPSILYVNTETNIEKTIAPTFEQFINSLVSVKSLSYDNEDFTDLPPVKFMSIEEATRVFQVSCNEEEIVQAIYDIQNNELHMNWFIDQLTLLSDRKSEWVVNTVAETLFNLLQFYQQEIDLHKARKLINKLEKCPYQDVHILLEDIKHLVQQI